MQASIGVRPRGRTVRRHGADARVDAAVKAQIDPSRRYFEEPQHCSAERIGLAATVTTERLWEASDDQSSTRTPGAASTASIAARTTLTRRPSLMLGMASIICCGR